MTGRDQPGLQLSQNHTQRRLIRGMTKSEWRSSKPRTESLATASSSFGEQAPNSKEYPSSNIQVGFGV